MDDEDKKDMLGRFLKNWAGTWWKVISDRVQTYSDFREKFLAQYWNIQIQRRVRDHLEFGTYHPSMNMTTTNYVLNVMAVSYTHLLENVSGPLMFPSSAFLILNLVEYLCAGWLLLWLPLGFWFFKLLLLCVVVVYVLVLLSLIHI